MDIKIEKKPWYIRYRYYMIAALAFIIFLIYVISLSLGPRKYNPQIEMFARFKMKSSFHKTKRII